MKNLIFIIIVLLSALVSDCYLTLLRAQNKQSQSTQKYFSSPIEMPPNKEMASYLRDLPKIFDHSVHQPQFDNGNLSCLTCHNMQVQKSAPTLTTPRWKIIDSEKMSATCHNCHVKKDVVNLATRCTACHTKTTPPKDHLKNIWLKNHKWETLSGTHTCSQCHENKDCIQCHQSRETIKADMHPRTYRYFHSIEARTQGKNCASCHQLKFCSDCHQQGVRP